MRRLAIIGSAVVVVVLAIALVIDLATGTTSTSTPRPQRPVPGATDSGSSTDVALPSLQFKRFDAKATAVRLQDLAAGRPMVVNIWSTSCIPCQQETPAIEKVQQQADGKVVIVGVDVSDTYDQGTKFIEKYHSTYTQVRDPQATLLTALGNSVLPTTYLVDRQGNVVDTHLGAVTASSLKAMVRSSLGVDLG